MITEPTLEQIAANSRAYKNRFGQWRVEIKTGKYGSTDYPCYNATDASDAIATAYNEYITTYRAVHAQPQQVTP